jgi:transcription elongation factor GreA
MRILNLEQKLRNARVLAAKEISTDAVGIGSLVHLKDVKQNDSFKYTIVHSAEADPSNHRLSSESPVGKAIMGKKAGETVKVTTPRGGIKYKIVSIRKG